MIWIKYLREGMEERVAEIRHWLIVETANGGSGCAPEFLDQEEELLDELRELERLLPREQFLREGPPCAFPGSGRGRADVMAPITPVARKQTSPLEGDSDKERIG